jgi:hypothetical protein
LDREFRSAPAGSGRGVSCNGHGAFLGTIPLLKRPEADGDWEPRDCAELSEQISDAFGLPIDMTLKMGGLNAITRALNNGDIARAQVATVLLGIPDPPEDSETSGLSDDIAKFVGALRWSGLIKIWEPELHPRWDAGAADHQGGQFKVADGDTDADEDAEPTVNGQTAEESRRASEIDNQAGAEDEKERIAEAAGQETEQQYCTRIDRNLSARDRCKFWKTEANSRIWEMSLPPEVYSEDNLKLMRRGLSPFGPDRLRMELHHPTGSNEDDVVPMTATDHRLGDNYLRNHQYLRTKKMDENDEIDKDDVTLIWLARDDSRGQFACVFEANERNSYIYLYHFIGKDGQEILGAQQVCTGAPDFTEKDVKIRWYDDETKVGVFIKGELGAYFDLVTWQGCPGTYWETRKTLSANGNGP